MRDRKHPHFFITVLIEDRHDDGTRSILRAFITSCVELPLPQIRISDHQTGIRFPGNAHGTASLADLLSNTRRPLAGTVEQLSRLAPLLDQDKDRIDAAIQKAPKNYRKLVRLGSMGATIPYYVCFLTLRGTDLNGKTVVAPMFRSEAGRCKEPNA